MFTATPIAIYQDNYVWVLKSAAEHWIVDPGDAAPVLDYFDKLGVDPCGILITHKHWDHVTGLKSLLKRYDLPVYGPGDTGLAEISRVVVEGDSIAVGAVKAQVWETPGHTRDHVSFYFPEVDALFCGDTLFAGGCGRVFDGSVEQLYHSLQRIAALPASTRIYCTHEYTVANLKFALEVEPDNKALIEQMEQMRALRRQSLPTLPSRLDVELRVNPFLRVREPGVQRSVLKRHLCEPNNPCGIFAALRQWKNHY